ncbi:MAG: hypothetical protein ACYDEJ_03430 [Desulfitobacteriaceae bacterium]
MSNIETWEKHRKITLLEDKVSRLEEQVEALIKDATILKKHVLIWPTVREAEAREYEQRRSRA